MKLFYYLIQLIQNVTGCDCCGAEMKNFVKRGLAGVGWGSGEWERGMGGMERGGGDGNQMGSLMEERRKQKIDDQYRCQPRPGLQ